MRRFHLLPALALPLALLAGLLTPAFAKPVFKQMALDRYGLAGSRLDHCNLCHTEGGGTDRNPYGLAFKEAGLTREAMAAIEGKDADADGVSNKLELLSGHFPGDKTDVPDQFEIIAAKRHGGWTALSDAEALALVKLIPGVSGSAFEWHLVVTKKGDAAAIKQAAAALATPDPAHVELAAIGGSANLLILHHFAHQGQTAFILLARTPAGAIGAAKIFLPGTASKELEHLSNKVKGLTAASSWDPAALVPAGTRVPPLLEDLLATVHQALVAANVAVPPK